MTLSLGKVYLVGAGLNAATLTQRGLVLIQAADVILYDALLDPTLLATARADCTCVPVGKRGGGMSTPQAEINQQLVAHCRAGKQVVRLKGGDPGVFGRSLPEITALQAASCAWEWVPGVSTALAAPLLAGIPLTDKAYSSGFAVMTAHDLDRLDWPALARLETVVFLMGGRNLGGIVARLQGAGVPRERAIAIIHAAGSPTQRVWRGTTADILEQVAGVSLSPCVIVVGDVVELQQISGGPLAGKRILVTRAAEQASQFCDLLVNLGAQVVEMPALEIQPPQSWAALDEAIAHLDQVNWLLLTSANGVQGFFQRLAHHGLDSRTLGRCKIAVVGRKTAQTLATYHLQPDFIPPDFIADALIDHFPEQITAQTFLFPRVETGGRDVLVKAFREQGATVWEVPAYESGCPATLAPAARTALEQGTIEIITFASSKTVVNAHHLLQAIPQWQTLLAPVKIASIGPQTSQACLDCFGRVDIEARSYTLEGLGEAIVADIQD